MHAGVRGGGDSSRLELKVSCSHPMKSNRIKFKCSGATCSHCKYTNGAHAGSTETHEVPMRVISISDDAATHEMMGVNPQCCFLCKTHLRKPAQPWDIESVDIQYYRDCNADYFAAKDAWEATDKQVAFKDSKHFEDWSQKWQISTSCCALSVLADLWDVRWCFLHMVLNMVNKLLEKTFINYATTQEATGKNGATKFASALSSIGLVTRAR